MSSTFILEMQVTTGHRLGQRLKSVGIGGRDAGEYSRSAVELTDDTVDVAGQEGGLEAARQRVEDHTKRLQDSQCTKSARIPRIDSRECGTKSVAV